MAEQGYLFSTVEVRCHPPLQNFKMPEQGYILPSVYVTFSHLSSFMLLKLQALDASFPLRSLPDIPNQFDRL